MEISNSSCCSFLLFLVRLGTIGLDFRDPAHALLLFCDIFPGADVARPGSTCMNIHIPNLPGWVSSSFASADAVFDDVEGQLRTPKKDIPRTVNQPECLPCRMGSNQDPARAMSTQSPSARATYHNQMFLWCLQVAVKMLSSTHTLVCVND